MHLPFWLGVTASNVATNRSPSKAIPARQKLEQILQWTTPEIRPLQQT
jgi:hypothetical protein